MEQVKPTAEQGPEREELSYDEFRQQLEEKYRAAFEKKHRDSERITAPTEAHVWYFVNTELWKHAKGTDSGRRFFEETLPQFLDSPESSELRDLLHFPFEALTEAVFGLHDQLAEYDTLVSDETSARLLTLFLCRVVNRAREDAGESKTDTFFIPAYDLSRDNRFDTAPVLERTQKRWSLLNKQISRRVEDIEKMLFVTEYVESGISLDALTHLFSSLNIDFDIFALSVRDDLGDYPWRVTPHLRTMRPSSVLGLRSFHTGPFKHKSGVSQSTEAPYLKANQYSREEQRKVREQLTVFADLVYDAVGEMAGELESQTYTAP